MDLNAMNRRMDELLGTPFEDNGRGATIDCFGVLLELWRAGGIELPDPVDPDKVADVAHMMPSYLRKVSVPELGCLVVVEHPRRRVDHVGVLLAPNVVGHAARGVGAVRTSLRVLVGRCEQRRTVSYYLPKGEVEA